MVSIKYSLKLCSLLLLMCLNLNAWALKDDHKKTISVTSLEQSADLNSNKVSFNGKVEATQGSIKILADKVEIFRNKQGKLSHIIAYGRPVQFSQKLDNGKTISSRSALLKYETKPGIVTLQGKAQIKQGESQLSGDKIEYNIATQRMRANTTNVQGGRVSSTFNPAELQQHEK